MNRRAPASRGRSLGLAVELAHSGCSFGGPIYQRTNVDRETDPAYVQVTASISRGSAALRQQLGDTCHKVIDERGSFWIQSGSIHERHHNAGRLNPTVTGSPHRVARSYLTCHEKHWVALYWRAESNSTHLHPPVRALSIDHNGAMR